MTATDNHTYAQPTTDDHTYDATNPLGQTYSSLMEMLERLFGYRPAMFVDVQLVVVKVGGVTLTYTMVTVTLTSSVAGPGFSIVRTAKRVYASLEVNFDESYYSDRWPCPIHG